jgi:hypothetical protein
MNIERVNFATPLCAGTSELQLNPRPRGMDGAAPSLAQQFSPLKRAGFRDVDCFGGDQYGDCRRSQRVII